MSRTEIEMASKQKHEEHSLHESVKEHLSQHTQQENNESIVEDSHNEEKHFLPATENGLPHITVDMMLEEFEKRQKVTKKRTCCNKIQHSTASFFAELFFCLLIIAFCFAQLLLQNSKSDPIYVLLLGIMVGYELGSFVKYLRAID